MWIDYDVQRNGRRCAETDRVFAPGEEFYSALLPSGDDPASDLVERRDYSRDAWRGPPENAIGWWRARTPDVSQKPRLAPNEVLLELFDRWADDPRRAAARYVLTLLLIRRRVLQPRPADEARSDGQAMAVFCPSRAAAYEVLVEVPGEQRAAEIQAELFALLYDRPPNPTPIQRADDATNKAA